MGDAWPQRKSDNTEDEEKEGWAENGQPAVRRAAFGQDGRYYQVLLAGCGSWDFGLCFLPSLSMLISLSRFLITSRSFFWMGVWLTELFFSEQGGSSFC